MPLSAQRCHNHAAREAAAKCMECGDFFCRECVSEHDHRVLCASCLLKLSTPRANTSPRFASAGRALLFLLAFFLIWIFFFTMGRALLAIPTSFHEGSIWESFQQ